jgi:hypothetical protein
MLAGNALEDMLASMKSMIDTGAWGLCANVLVFAVVSNCTRADAPPEQEKPI